MLDLLNVHKINKWDRRYMELAGQVGSWSKQEVKVGCIIVNAENNRIISTGFNDRPKFLDGIHLPHKCGITHAEINAIVGLSAITSFPFQPECKVYVTKPPCHECAQFLYHNINIKQVITVPADSASSWLSSQCRAQEFLESNGVEWVVLND